jgi:hypothetical protein
MSDKQQQQAESTKQEVKSPVGDENVKKFPRSETEASLRRTGVLSEEVSLNRRRRRERVHDLFFWFFTGSHENAERFAKFKGNCNQSNQ